VSDWALHCTDCITGLREHAAPESIDLTVTSIPFGALFQYSGKTEDIGNSLDGTDFVQTYFGAHLRFFVEALIEATRPGTNVCIHIQQLVSYRIQHGYMGRRDFRGAVVDVFEAAGFEWRGEVAIPKNPQVIAQRQNLNSLMFVTGRRNSRDLAPAVNDYVLTFQKPGEATPVRALAGEGNPDGWVTTEEWIKWAHGVWDDIRETDVLEGWEKGREADDEKHVCPLQLEVIRRCVRLYSNPGDLVCDPFMGIGSTGYVARQLGRRALGFELKESYAAQAERNIASALERSPEDQLSLEAA
jgi:DNA modification methylase